MKCGCTLFLILGWLSIGTFASAQKKFNEADFDSSYYVSYVEQLAVRGYLVNKGQLFELQSPQLTRNIRYIPNSPFGIGIGVQYKWFGLALALPVPPNEKEQARKGTTKQFDLQGNILVGRRFGLDGHIQRYEGFYLDDTQNRLPGYPQEYYTRPDIVTYSGGLNAYWIFNWKRYSFRAGSLFNERQLKSAGSFLASPTLSLYQIQADSSFIPGNLRQPGIEPAEWGVTKVQFITLGASVGYTYTYVFDKRFYAFGTVFAGPATIRYQAQTTEGALSNGWRLSGRGNLRFGMGYNDENWFAGASIVADVYNLKFNDQLRFTYNVAAFRFFVGHRFGANFLKKKA